MERSLFIVASSCWYQIENLFICSPSEEDGCVIMLWFVHRYVSKPWMKAGVFLSPLCWDSQEIEAGVNRKVIICVIGLSYLTDVWLQEVFSSPFHLIVSL